ncbi:MAG TPA: hypothetical protein VFQ84_09015 [Arenimonas sp.]|uniref:hypothetical protein n=1 Tax=Arenimonas sp. TaxID=1872635 RepID=UPI002D7FD918|nr:hypothetical protein [Arenimonas sp.]HEU0153470.1 hypothetical protein [Arenimonas sp.]
MNLQAEFLVEDVRKDKSGRLVIVGIPNRGRGVRVGDTFVMRYDVPRSLEDVLDERPLADPTNQRAVSLRVTAIDSMRTLIEELPLGVTGGLYLEGDGIECLAKRTFLKTAESNP